MQAALAPGSNADVVDSVLVSPVAERSPESVDVLVLLDTGRKSTVAWVDELAGTVLDLWQADGLVETLREVRHVEQLEHDTLPVNSDQTVAQLGDRGAAVELAVCEETAITQIDFVLFLGALYGLRVWIAIGVNAKRDTKHIQSGKKPWYTFKYKGDAKHI